jgi:IS4 transposase
MEAPAYIDDFEVLEYGYFGEPFMPKGYLPPVDAAPSLKPAQNVAICRRVGTEGYYTLFCTTNWEYVTGQFNETMESARQTAVAEYWQDVVKWNTRS